MKRSKNNKPLVILLALFLLSGTGVYWVHTGRLESEVTELKSDLISAENQLYRREKEIMGLMMQFDSLTLKREAEKTYVMKLEKALQESAVSPISPQPTVVSDRPTQKPALVLDGKEVREDTPINLAVKFAPNSHQLSVTNELKEISSFLKQHSKVSITLSGHTQANPEATASTYQETVDMLLDLSKRRVETVAKFFVEDGVLPQQIKTAYYGGSQPRYQDSKLNRRVEMQIKYD